MPLPPLAPPPPTGNPVLDKWLYQVWRKLGEASDVAPISVSGQAATAAVATTALAADSVPPAPVSGAPVTETDPGSFAFDEGTGKRYYNPTGDPGDWVEMA